MHGKVSENFARCVIKQEIALSPRRIKDEFHLYFQSFHNFVKTLKIRVKIYP